MYSHEKCVRYINAVLPVYPDSILVIKNYIVTTLLL